MRISTLLPLSAAAIAQKSRSTETKEKISDIDVCKALTGACALRPIRKEEGSLLRNCDRGATECWLGHHPSSIVLAPFVDARLPLNLFLALSDLAAPTIRLRSARV